MKLKAKIALEDGTIFEGFSFGASTETEGEVVFNTSLTGYQEILTDPSYKGQIVTMTYPLIGNYGINPDDVESHKPFVEGFVVRENSAIVSNWRAQKSLDEYLKEHNIVGITGVDTRALARHIRLEGAMKAVISSKDLNDESLVKKARLSQGLVGRDCVKDVACKQSFIWNESISASAKKSKKHRVVVLDCGVKFNILRHLVENNCEVVVMPASSKAGLIASQKPDGILLSNGPGDPEGVPYVVDTVKQLIGKLPIFGICLGQQILGLALGGKTYKLKFGHHGGNQPVKDLKTGKIDITVQNHGFCVDIDSLNKDDIEITHMNLNDNTLEGMRHKKLPIASVQFHPEAGPGPHDANYLFGTFVKMIKEFKR
ncbi:glutamine-hydrolyzing carbamoyl-phosphate synthase small subunit [Candidatus Omnitrophota bacterium]